MSRLITQISEWFAVRETLGNRRLGFVPTMGALHQGHLALVERAKSENDFTVVSVFVNPTQFNDPKDFASYPHTLDADVALLNTAGADYVFAPTGEQMYPDGYCYRVTEIDLSSKLCGAHRPGHFEGMLTVVLKLLNLMGANRAYFGEKDLQQLELIKGMAAALFLKTKIVGCPTVREADGLALSSRNTRLNSQERAIAPKIYRALRGASDPTEARTLLEAAGFRVDYVEEILGRRLVAASLGNVRLIDNVCL